MHLFMMTDLALDCGSSGSESSITHALLGPYATSWPAVVDTGTACLTLPAEMFDILSSWWQVCGYWGSLDF